MPAPTSATTADPSFKFPVNAPLFRRLRRPLVDNARTRLYQASLDAAVDELKQDYDLQRGLRGAAGVPLPHEDDPDYWTLSPQEREQRTTPEAAEVYARNAGRSGTASLAVAAFCWRSPLSRHHQDPELLRYFQAGLRYFTQTIRDDGVMASFGLNGEGWAHGWDLEGLIYGIGFCYEKLDSAVLDQAVAALRRSAKRFMTVTEIGNYGNQRAVYTLGLHLYGQLLDEPDLIELADRHWADIMPKVLDASGQVVEQHGPCMHYSYTGFIYAWLNLVIRDDESELGRVLENLRWFRARFTESMYPVAGPTARKYSETLRRVEADLLPAAEQVAKRDSSVRDFADRVLLQLENGTVESQNRAGSWDSQVFRPRWSAMDMNRKLTDCDTLRAGRMGHGASPMMWAILMAEPGDEGATVAQMPPAPSLERCYDTLALQHRFSMKYALVRHRYQTHFNFRDFMPFSGIQTWALDREAPILHPTPLYPSTTIGQGLDTARQGASHNWRMFGAGSMGIDGYFRNAESPNELSFLIARYDWLWKLVFFTEQSTVQLEFGRGGARQTYWTLHRVDPTTPLVEDHRVRFADRKACLHSTIAQPTVAQRTEDHAWAHGVQQLVYDCGDGPALFALSDESFRIEGAFQPLVDRKLRFADAAGRYEVTLHEGFLQADNPGNFNIDVYQLAYHGTAAKRV